MHRALKLKAAASDRFVSETVNDAVRVALAEDAEDPEALEERAVEPELLFEDFVKSLRRREKLSPLDQEVGRRGDRADRT